MTRSMAAVTLAAVLSGACSGSEQVTTAQDAAATSDFRAYMRSNFSETSWYSGIDSVYVDGNGRAVISFDSGADRGAICQSARGWVNSNLNDHDVSGPVAESGSC